MAKEMEGEHRTKTLGEYPEVQLRRGEHKERSYDDDLRCGIGAGSTVSACFHFRSEVRL